MGEYIAHKKDGRTQTLKEHLDNTAFLAGEFAEKFGKGEWGYCAGLLHDIGKYSEEFQYKIINDTNDKVDHSTAGAQLCQQLEGPYSLLCYLIAGHHTGLPNYGTTMGITDLRTRLKKEICNFQAYQKEITIPALNTEPFSFEQSKDINFSLSVFIRMLYSCLVDADHLDTESFMTDHSIDRNSGEPITVLLKKMQDYITTYFHEVEIDTLNGRRNEILQHCLDMGEEDKGVYRLTAPTGGGKTTASLAFALKHAAKHHMDRIIYVIPYTSIIEQNAQRFREILGNENILEDHCNVDFNSKEELSSLQLASENWDKPVVVTTNVQFFESLFSNRSSKCKKLHNIANSIIILDEAQMFPIDYLKPCTSVLRELVDNYRSTVVLCTATQPALDPYISNVPIKELCPRMEEQFDFFQRVKYEKLGEITIDALTEAMREEFCALCVVNTKKLAQKIYTELQGEGVFHLSAAMYPKHRKRTLDKIRERLKDKKKCIVISTSLIEAGVDLDFQHVYRQMAGLDSIIQAAGRCNREGEDHNISNSRVYIFDLKDERIPFEQKQLIDITRSIMQDHEDFTSLSAIRDYYHRLYNYRRSSLDIKKIMDEFQGYECNFEKVSKNFKLIEQETVNLIINNEPEINTLLLEIKEKGISKERIRKIGPYCIQLYFDDTKTNSYSILRRLKDLNQIRPLADGINDFYILTDLDKYSKEYGLDLLS